MFDMSNSLALLNVQNIVIYFAVFEMISLFSQWTKRCNVDHLLFHII